MIESYNVLVYYKSYLDGTVHKVQLVLTANIDLPYSKGGLSLAL